MGKKYYIFKKLSDILLEGGGTEIINPKTGNVLGSTEKIDLNKIPRNFIRKEIIQGLRILNQKYNRRYGEPLWTDFSKIEDGYLFNGSTTHFFTDKITDQKYLAHKPILGDIDLLIPREKIRKFLDLLADIQGEKITEVFRFLGQYKNVRADMAITGFGLTYNGYETVVQIDLEAADFEGDIPKEFFKFGHSSAWEDIELGIKGVAHKYLLRALANVTSQIDNETIFLTPASTLEKPKIKKLKDSESQRLLSFSVDKGLRVKFERVLDMNGEPAFIDGKPVFKETKTENSKYYQAKSDIFEMIFGKKPDFKELKLMDSYIGLLEVVDKLLTKDVIKNVYDALMHMSYKSGSQPLGLTRDEDLKVKTAYLQKFVERFPYVDWGESLNKKTIEEYVADEWKINESFFLNEAAMLDISIKNADKEIKTDVQAGILLNEWISIEEKIDGTKLTLVRKDTPFDPNDFHNNFEISYKGMIVWDDEFSGINRELIKTSSIGLSQYALVIDHFKKINPNLGGIPLNTEFFIEFMMDKTTLTRDYKEKHGLVLIAWSPTKWRVVGDRLISNPTDFLIKGREKWAEVLGISVPPKLFEGKAKTGKDLIDGSLNERWKNAVENLRGEFDTKVDWWDKWQVFREICLTPESQFGGETEGVVITRKDGSVIKILRADQHDKATRNAKKDRWRMDFEDETNFYKAIYEIAQSIIDKVGSGSLRSRLADISKLSYHSAYTLPYHSKKSEHMIRDDVYMTARTLLGRTLPGNNNALFIGKFQPPTKAHISIIEDALKRYDHILIAIPREGKGNLKIFPFDIQKEIFYNRFGDRVILIEIGSGNIKGILRDAPVVITAVLAGTDRIDGYREQLEGVEGIALEETPRTDEDISATKVRKSLESGDKIEFQKMMDKSTWNYYDRLRSIYLSNKK